MADRPKRVNAGKPAPTLKDILPGRKPALTKRAYNKNFRDKFKGDPERYEEFKNAERARLKAYREKVKKEGDAAKKDDRLAKQRERQRRYRERLDEKRKVPAPAETPSAVRLTRCQQQKAEERRERNPLSAKKMRENYTPQKRAARNRQRMDRYWRKKLQDISNQEQATPDSHAAQEDTGPFPSLTALQSSIKRVKGVMEAKGDRFAHVLCSMVKNASSPVKKVLRSKNVCFSPTLTGIKKDFSQLMSDLKKRRDRHSLTVKRTLFSKMGDTSKALMGRVKFSSPSADLYRKEKRCRAAVVHHLEQVASDVPEKRAVSKRTSCSKKVLTSSMMTIHRRFSVDGAPEISLRSFYRHRPAHIQSVAKNKFRQCICDICYNAKSKLKVLNMHISEHYDLDALLGHTMCEKTGGVFHPIACVRRDCSECGVKQFKEVIEKNLDSKLSLTVSFPSWEVDKTGTSTRMVKITRRETLQILVDNLFESLKGLSLHRFHDLWQRQQFHSLKDNLPQHSVLLVMDFAENYACRQQDEAQSAYWGYSQVTVHPVVAYRNCECGDRVVHNLVFLSDDLKHDSHIVDVFFRRAVNHLGSFDCLTKAFIFSDGCAGQYKSKLPFYYLSCSALPSEKAFFGARHGKNACDALGGTVKSLCSSLVASNDVIIASATDMLGVCQENFQVEEMGACGKVHKERKFFLVLSDEINRRSISSDDIRTIDGTRSLHHLRSVRRGVVSTRKLACFCLFCLGAGGERCENDAFVDEWKEVCLAEGASEISPPSVDVSVSVPEVISPVTETTSEGEVSDPSSDTGSCRVKIGSFYMVAWEGKNYVAQVLDMDGDMVKVNYMKWFVGQLQWGGDDISWENIEDIGSEVSLCMNERTSTQRIQRFTYSFVL